MYSNLILYLICMGLFSLDASGRDDKFNDIRRLNELTARILSEREVSSKKMGAVVRQLAILKRNIRQNSKINPLEEDWKGQYVYALKQRRQLEKNWFRLKTDLAVYKTAKPYQRLSKQVESYLEFRRKGQYTAAFDLVRSQGFKQNFAEFMSFLSKNTDQSDIYKAHLSNIQDITERLQRGHSKELVGASSPVTQQVNGGYPESSSPEKLVWKPQDSKQSAVPGLAWLFLGLVGGFMLNKVRRKSNTKIMKSPVPLGRKKNIAVFDKQLQCIQTLSQACLAREIVESFSDIEDGDEREQAVHQVLGHVEFFIRNASNESLTDVAELREVIKVAFKKIQEEVHQLKKQEQSLLTKAQISAYRRVLHRLIEAGECSRSISRLSYKKSS